MMTENTTAQASAATLTAREFEILAGAIDKRAKALRKEHEHFQHRVSAQVRNELSRMSDDQRKQVKELLHRYGAHMANASRQLVAGLGKAGVTFESGAEGFLNSVHLAFKVGNVAEQTMRDIVDRYHEDLVRPAWESARREAEAA